MVVTDFENSSINPLNMYALLFKSPVFTQKREVV